MSSLHLQRNMRSLLRGRKGDGHVTGGLRVVVVAVRFLLYTGSSIRGILHMSHTTHYDTGVDFEHDRADKTQ